MNTFEAWFAENLSECAGDIAAHGADAGFPHITYTSDTVAIFDTYGDEIWDMGVEAAEESGCKNICEMIAGFGRADMLHSLDTFKNLMVWFACEELARRRVLP